MAKLCQMKNHITNDTDNDSGAANDNAKLNKIVTNNMQHKTYIRCSKIFSQMYTKLVTIFSKTYCLIIITLRGKQIGMKTINTDESHA